MIAFLTIAYVLFVLGAVAIRWHRGRRAIAHAQAGRELVRRTWRDARPEPAIRVVLFLPMLREQTEVAALLEHLCTLDFPSERVTLVPITSEVETAQRARLADAAAAVIADLRAGAGGLSFLWKHSVHFSTSRLEELRRMGADHAEAALAADLARPATREVVEALLASHDYRKPVMPVHYPGIMGNKASQMNYALDVLRERGLFAEAERTYVGVYDADSRPAVLTLASLAVAAARELAPAFQQYPVYFNGSRLGNRLMRNEAWLQTARSVCIEYGGQLEANRALERGRATGRTFTYCIGHGEFLRADWLLRTRFPEEQAIDDLPTGIMLSLARQQIVPLPFFDFCTVPYGVLDFVRQTGTWFSACLDFAGPLRMARRHFGAVPTLRELRGRVELCISNARWAVRGPVRVLMLAMTLVAAAWPLALLLLAAWTIETFVLWRTTRRLIDTHGDTERLPRLRFHWTALLRAPLKSAGPWVYALQRLRGGGRAHYKTARA